VEQTVNVTKKTPLLSQLLKDFFVLKIPLVFFVIAHASLWFSQPSKRINFKTAKRIKEKV